MNPKQAAGERGAELVEDGMVVGLGTGSTAWWFIETLGRRVREEGLRITAVATSVASTDQAQGLGIEVVERVDGEIDLTVDGADEIDPRLDLVKGLGGALLREKVVAAASRRMVVVATDDKLVERLGRGPLPVEILPFLGGITIARLERLGLEPVLRVDGDSPFVSDNGNWIADCGMGAQSMIELPELAATIEAVPGVLGHGLFLGLASRAFVADADGKVRELRSPTA